MDKEHDKFMNDLHRLLGTQDFKNEDDLKSFLDSIAGKKIPSFSKNALNNKEQAQDLVLEAYELTPVKARKKIEKALELDPDCIEAYEYLSGCESSLELESVFLEKLLLEDNYSLETILNIIKGIFGVFSKHGLLCAAYNSIRKFCI